ncbi:hypothetical protein S7711_11639 [Stachybotrys chartarum IBT 7711]|uniref:Uncharacterized protein n=1 Tax=Stachybotrys chartarum (strain CBS 109288 / IBT 7711) TaxID=1280523 RepID=A0A084AU46_STACB|nr:hypothetical protein S7711_11639 [Stachybotrys chartarum IBT 7711]
MNSPLKGLRNKLAKP